MNRAQILASLHDRYAEMRRDFAVANIGVFGSAARDELRDDSDIDILVEFIPTAHVGLFRFVRLQQHLEQLLGRKVDLATPNALKHQLREQIFRELIRAA